jgi:hypothetical protein
VYELPECDQHQRFFRSARPVTSAFVARKASDSTAHRVPSQSCYRAPHASANSAPETVPPSRSGMRRLRRSIGERLPAWALTAYFRAVRGHDPRGPFTGLRRFATLE